MDRNLILAIVLSVVIIVVFQYFFQAFSPPPAKTVPATTEKAEPRTPSPVTTPAVPGERPSVAREAAPEAKPAPSTARPTPEGTVAPLIKESLVKVDTPKYEALISTKGARIISFKLKDYTTTLNSKELVNLFAPEELDTSGPSIMFTRRDETFNDASLSYTYDSLETSLSLTGTGAKKSITLRTTTAAGIGIAKTFVFNSDNYDVGFSFTVSNKSNEDRNYLVTLPWRKAFHEDSSNRFSWDSVEILLNGELKDYYFKDIKGDEEPSGKVEWAGLGDVYFFKALVFGKHPAAKVTLFKPTKENVAEVWVRYGAVDIPQGREVTTDLYLYLGPKEREALGVAGNDLSKALFYSNYKILDILSEYLMKFLRFCNSGFQVAGIKIPGTHNYGIDIILLTIIIKILFIPLTHKSMKSMKRMQDLQPQLAKLKEKFKDDKASMNKATMELFREQKVNPLGGCWPMFLQMPVFIALYQALSYAIEMRHAPFVCIPSIYLCINDLSAPDPYYVTPILMSGTMVLQQWMTPSGGDPTQKKMMLMMPVVFTYLFLSFPSGLVLYWLVSNVLSIGQQVMTNKMAK